MTGEIPPKKKGAARELSREAGRPRNDGCAIDSRPGVVSRVMESHATAVASTPPRD